jgi:NAD(P)-dependent dehydrogenase (short-subunit alcohol dehydrogenase family)
MGVMAISGAASGIGRAARQRLEREGHQVLGIDLRGVEVACDLSAPDGRRFAVWKVREHTGGKLDGLLACAGLGPQCADRPQVVAVNYFGAVALLEGLRDCLAAGAPSAAVAISSNSSTITNMETPLVAACLEGDEARARTLAADLGGTQVYAGSKLALARWVRRHAPKREWAGAGVRLNAVAPGATLTPLLQEGLDDPLYGDAIRNFPVPLGGFGRPEQIADTIAFLLGPESSFCCGSVLFVDGGSDALLRPDTY